MHINDILDLPDLQAIKARFEQKFVRGAPNDCWNWTAAQSHNGYGLVTFAGGSRRAHRVSYVLYNGPLPTRTPLVIRHRCNNPLCVNPTHLRPGTQTQNSHDRLMSGRWWGAGESNPGAKLTRKQVSAIRLDPRRPSEVAPEYGVDPATIGEIRRYRMWKSVRTQTAVAQHTSGAPGEANGRAKLTTEQVRAIRSDARKYPVIAAAYGVGRETVGNIKRRETWAHIP